MSAPAMSASPMVRGRYVGASPSFSSSVDASTKAGSRSRLSHSAAGRAAVLNAVTSARARRASNGRSTTSSRSSNKSASGGGGGGGRVKGHHTRIKIDGGPLLGPHGPLLLPMIQEEMRANGVQSPCEEEYLRSRAVEESGSPNGTRAIGERSRRSSRRRHSTGSKGPRDCIPLARAVPLVMAVPIAGAVHEACRRGSCSGAASIGTTSDSKLTELRSMLLADNKHELNPPHSTREETADSKTYGIKVHRIEVCHPQHRQREQNPAQMTDDALRTFSSSTGTNLTGGRTLGTSRTLLSTGRHSLSTSYRTSLTGGAASSSSSSDSRTVKIVQWKKKLPASEKLKVRCGDCRKRWSVSSACRTLYCRECGALTPIDIDEVKREAERRRQKERVMSEKRRRR